MAIKVGGNTVIDDNQVIRNVTGAITGIQSGGQAVGVGATIINFTGSGNVIEYDAGTNTLDVQIAGGGGGVGGINTTSFFSNPSLIEQDATLDAPNTNYFVAGPVTVNPGVTITVGASSTFRVL